MKLLFIAAILGGSVYYYCILALMYCMGTYAVLYGTYAVL